MDLAEGNEGPTGLVPIGLSQGAVVETADGFVVGLESANDHDGLSALQVRGLLTGHNIATNGDCDEGKENQESKAVFQN